jgi:LacI family transcriptional regulator
MAATIRQIAQMVGVSPAAVSFVLNNKPGIGQETRDRVLAAVAALGYKPKAPVKNNTKTLRFLRIAKNGHIINPSHKVFIADYIDGIEQEAQRCGYAMEISSFDSFDPVEVLNSLSQGNLAGAIVLGTELDEQDLVQLTTANLPLVFIDTYHSTLPFDFVDMDNDSSVYAIVKYLLEQGHKKIGLVTSVIETRNFAERGRSFSECLDHLGLEFDRKDLFMIDSTYERGCEDMDALLADRTGLPTALFCVNDIIAYGCLMALKARGYSVPGDVSLFGFDDLPSDEYMSPPLSSVKVSKHRIGQCAMELLAKRIDNPSRPPEKVLIGGSLVVRESVRKI